MIGYFLFYEHLCYLTSYKSLCCFKYYLFTFDWFLTYIFSCDKQEGNHGPGDDMHGMTSLSTSVCVGGDEQEKEPTLETTSVRLINSGHIIFQVHLEAHIAKAHIE